jgi:hypothetical protein
MIFLLRRNFFVFQSVTRFEIFSVMLLNQGFILLNFINLTIAANDFYAAITDIFTASINLETVIN